MHFTKKSVSEKRSDFVKKLQSKKLLRFPGAYNPLCAKLIAEIGFDGVYISGGVMSNDLGLPDIGLTTMDQVSYRSGQIARVTDLPTISLWALFGSGLRKFVNNTKIKKTIEYLLATLLILTGLFILLK